MKTTSDGAKKRGRGAVEMPGLWKAWKTESRFPTFPSRFATMITAYSPRTRQRPSAARRSRAASGAIVVDREK